MVEIPCWGAMMADINPLIDEQLDAIESFWSQRLNRDHPTVDKACHDIPRLTAEIRRLRSRSPLLNLLWSCLRWR